MRERERASIRDFMEAERAEQQRQREEAERPIKEAEARFNATARELYNTVRERLLTQRDDEFVIDPATTVPIPTDSVPDWQREQGELFKRRTPEYEPSDANFAVIRDYINRNAPNIQLVSALQFEWAFKRLREYGLLKERPAFQPTPVPDFTRRAPVSVAIERKAEPKTFEGIDLTTGLKRRFTNYEVDRMDSDTFRRVFQLVGDKKPAFVDPR